MMYFLGARPYKILDDNTGEVLNEGVTVWFCDDSDEKTVGVLPVKSSMSNKVFNEVMGGFKAIQGKSYHPVNVVYNRYGKPQQVEFLPFEE